MNKIRRNYKKLAIWILIITQILLILSYFYLKSPNKALTSQKITFVTSNIELPQKYAYHTSTSRISLKKVSTRTNYVNFNSSLCYKNGTDLLSMTRLKNIKWECTCLKGWHGKDCGQPEVIWRAFLTYKTPVKISGPRIFERKLIYLFEVDKFSETLSEIRINELGDIVDLFVLYGDFKDVLSNDVLKKYHQKVLCIGKNQLSGMLSDILNNLEDDDIILTSQRDEIFNKHALNFLKFYNKWPEPFTFRLRWSVFGFFWVHPSKTIIRSGGCSVFYFKQNFNSDIKFLGRNMSFSNNKAKQIILGDLNHFGGWYCEYCLEDTTKIIEYLSENNKKIDLEKIIDKKIDGAFIEDVIGNGLYVDGKIELIRAHKYRENYFAPFHVLENYVKYDYLLNNFYSKIDYYD